MAMVHDLVSRAVDLIGATRHRLRQVDHRANGKSNVALLTISQQQFVDIRRPCG